VVYQTQAGLILALLFVLGALSPTSEQQGDYQASLTVVDLPEPDICHPGVSISANEHLRATAAMTLTLTAGEEGFIYRMVQPRLSMGVNSDITEVTGRDQNIFSVRHRSDLGQTTVAAFSGSLELTPSNPLLDPFTLAEGQRVTITNDEIIPQLPLDRVGLPLVLSLGN
jgi:hypothetical protein